MKIFKVAFLVGFLGLVLSSCLGESRDNNSPSYGNLAITSAEVTDLQPSGKTTTIAVYFNVANSCQKFVQFQRQQVDAKTFMVAVVGSQANDQNCTQVSEVKNESLKFTAPGPGTYTFKFLTGNDSNGAPTFYTLEVEIPQPTQN